MLEVSGFWDYLWIVICSGALGALGGLAGRLVPQPDGAKVDQAMPRVNSKHAALLGAVAAAASLAFLTPTETRVVRTEEITELDILKLVGVSLIVGTAGAAVIRAAQARVLAAINAEKAEQTSKQAEQQLEQMGATAPNVAADVAKEALADVVEQANLQIREGSNRTPPQVEQALRAHFGSEVPSEIAEAVTATADPAALELDLNEIAEKVAEKARSAAQEAMQPRVEEAKRAVASAAS